MKKTSICIISDTHSNHKYLRNLPKADIIIHCGDVSNIGREHEIIDFLNWFSKLKQFKHKIFIAGNHDWLFQNQGLMARSLVPKNIHYLENNSIVINGLFFYGTPVQLPFNNWAFNIDEPKLTEYWKAIPDETDILITHSPPYMIGDYIDWSQEHGGSISLRNEIFKRIKPIINCYGHIHDEHGIKIHNDITFINASNLNEEYLCVYDPIFIEIDENKKVKVID